MPRFHMTAFAALCLAVFAAASPRPAAAAPRTVADIAPVHGLVAAVMEGVGAPDMLIRPGASPHGYAMKPSEAEALSEAEIVIWTGPKLTPWLARAIDNLAPKARSVDLSEVDEMTLLPARDGVRFEHHHHDEDGHGRGHGHDHGHDDEGKDDHSKDGMDPHFWLDPENAKTILRATAAALSAADPENAETYRRNAEEAAMGIDEAAQAAVKTLAPARERPFVVNHDAFHYFEARFGIEAVGALSLSDAARPGPKRVEEIRRAIAEDGVVCVFGEPQSPTKLAESVAESAGAKVAVLDPIGSDLPPGRDHYPSLITRIAKAMAACLTR